MARLIRILAASIGGGLMLGAGIRLGEALVARDLPHKRKAEIDGTLAERLGALEARLVNQAGEVEAIRSPAATDHQQLEALDEISIRLRGELRGWLEESIGARMADVQSKLREESERSQKEMLEARLVNQAGEVEAIRSPAATDHQQLEALDEISIRLRGELRGWLEESIGARMADVQSKLREESERSQKEMLEARLVNQAGEVEAIRSPAATDHQQLEALDEISIRLRGELRGWLEESIGARMADVQSKLREESERSQKEMLDAFADKVQKRVMHRISRLEDEVAGQSVAMTELRECAFRTEQSMQKLLGGMNRLIVAQPAPVADMPVPRNTAAQEDDSEPRQPLEEPEMPAEPKFPAEPPRNPRRWGIFS